MRGCAGLKLSEACARGADGAMARGWSVPQSRPRVAVPSGLFLGNRRTCGSRLESVFCCVLTGLLFISERSGSTAGRTADRPLQPVVKCSFRDHRTIA